MKLLGWFRWLLLWLFVITVANSTLTLNDSFRYCTQNSANIQADFAAECVFDSTKFSKKLQQYAVFEKNDYTLDACGF